jgi:hypothetical protein
MSVQCADLRYDRVGQGRRRRKEKIKQEFFVMFLHDRPHRERKNSR